MTGEEIGIGDTVIMTHEMDGKITTKPGKVIYTTSMSAFVDFGPDRPLDQHGEPFGHIGLGWQNLPEPTGWMVRHAFLERFEPEPIPEETTWWANDVPD